MRSAGNVSDGRGLEGGAAQKELGGGGGWAVGREVRDPWGGVETMA